MLLTDKPSREVFIVDDDPSSRDLLTLRFEEAGFRPVPFADKASVVDAARAATPACIIVDLCMSDGSGFDVLDQLDARNYPAPIFVSSGRGNIQSAVEAIKRGACDFFEKSQDHGVVIARVSEALKTWTRPRPNGGATTLDFPGSATLTPRERDVLSQIVGCSSNKESAMTLGISQRTVEIHRAHIMHKLRRQECRRAHPHRRSAPDTPRPCRRPHREWRRSARALQPLPTASSANVSPASPSDPVSSPLPTRGPAAMSK